MSIRFAALGLASLSLATVVGCSSSDDNSSSSSSTSSSSGSTSDAGGKSSTSSSSSTSGSTATGGSGPLSCNSPTDNSCTSYSSAPDTTTAYCQILGKGYTAVPACPTDDLQATCSFKAAGVDEVFYYYKAGNYGATGLKNTCDALDGTLVTK